MNLSEEQYPVLELLPELIKKFSSHNTVILQAPPGAGKSTALPLSIISGEYLNNEKIIMLQPRRLAAKAVATRMSQLLNEKVGETIGYKIRFESKLSEKTKIEVVTEGILTRMLQQDPTLEGVGMIIFDEFHERSIHADLAYALAKDVQKVLRPELKILIMSATVSPDLIFQLKEVPLLQSQGRQHPVDIVYASFETDKYIVERVSSAIRQSLATDDGDILVFLPGAGEIIKVLTMLESENFSKVRFLPLYGDLTFEKQQEAIATDKHGLRKVILSTSIAETSLTIEGIKVVIDSGLARVPKFNPKTGLSRLETVPVTKDAADQRAGRAGRLGPGKCYRLWTQKNHYQLSDQRIPEILESDLSTLLLEVSKWGIKNIIQLPWITTPPVAGITMARNYLETVGALDGNNITPRGEEMLSLPTHPRIAHLLLEGKKKGKLPLAIDIAAILEERDPLKKEDGASLGIRIEALRKYRAGKISYNSDGFARIEKTTTIWRKLFNSKSELAPFTDSDAGFLIFCAYPDRLATQKENDPLRYRLGNGRVAKLEDGDGLQKEKWLAIAHLDQGQKEGKIFLAAPVNLHDLKDEVYTKEVVKWNTEKGMLVCAIEKRVGAVVLQTLPLVKINEDLRIEELCNALRTEGLKLLDKNEKVASIQSRVLSLRQWGHESLPDISDEQLLNTVSLWLPPFLEGVKRREDFHKLDFYSILKNILSWEEQKLVDGHAPEFIAVPSGSDIPLKYDNHASPPVLAVRLQEVFGLFDTPKICGGKVKVMIHLLSPGYKPVQVTQDLRSFWTNTYHDVRKELRVRYSKHYWPEDPFEAVAVKGAKKRIVR